MGDEEKNLNNDWERHSLLVLETIKDLKENYKSLEARMRDLEKKVIAITSVIGFLVFVVELVAKFV